MGSCFSSRIGATSTDFVTLYVYYGNVNVGTTLQPCNVSTIDKSTPEYPVFDCSFTVSTVPLPGAIQFSVWNLSIRPPYEVRHPLGTVIVRGMSPPPPPRVVNELVLTFWAFEHPNSFTTLTPLVVRTAKNTKPITMYGIDIYPQMVSLDTDYRGGTALFYPFQEFTLLDEV